MEIRIGMNKVEVANKDGYYETPIGPIEVEILDTSLGKSRQVVLEGEVMRGTPLRNRHKRTTSKTVSLNEYGQGAQDLSKRERVYVDLYPELGEQSMRDVQVLFRDDGY